MGVAAAKQLAVDQGLGRSVAPARRRRDRQRRRADALDDLPVAEKIIVRAKEAPAIGAAQPGAVADQAEVGAVDLLGDNPALAAKQPEAALVQPPLLRRLGDFIV